MKYLIGLHDEPLSMVILKKSFLFDVVGFCALLVLITFTMSEELSLIDTLMLILCSLNVQALGPVLSPTAHPFDAYPLGCKLFEHSHTSARPPALPPGEPLIVSASSMGS